jgi:hypothetical protein
MIQLKFRLENDYLPISRQIAVFFYFNVVIHSYPELAYHVRIKNEKKFTLLVEF